MNVQQLYASGWCQCGCGARTRLYRGKPRRFLRGHHARGTNNGRYGKEVSATTRKKLSQSAQRLHEQGRLLVTQAGWKHSDAARQKMREAHARAGYAPRTPRRGNTHTCKTCGISYYRPQCVKQTDYCSLRCSGIANCSGAKNPFFGKHHTAKTRAALAVLAAKQRQQAPVLPTNPERLVHFELARRGISFVPERAIGKFCVDVLIPSMNTVIFVDGCYWHACPAHFPNAKRPKTDNARIPYLSKCGFKVIILWEHDILNNVSESLEKALCLLPSATT